MPEANGRIMLYALITTAILILAIAPPFAAAEFEESVQTLRVSTFDLTTSLSNGSVKSIDVDAEFDSIILTVETSETRDGELIITLPRALIDSKYDSADDEFIVLVNGEEADFDETSTTSTERTLKIPVPAGAEEVEIIGTQLSEYSTEASGGINESDYSSEASGGIDYSVIAAFGIAGVILAFLLITVPVVRKPN